MPRSRILLVACGTGILMLGACGSDAKKSSTGSSTTSTSTVRSSLPPVTATTIAGSTGVTTAATSTGVTTAATTAATTKATTAGATTTTVKGRVVTSPSDNVRLGDSGDGVTKIQFALKANGYNVAVDGKFGNQTDTAVRAFQKKNGLKQDGIVGKITWAKLSSATTTATTTSSATTTTVKP